MNEYAVADLKEYLKALEDDFKQCPEFYLSEDIEEHNAKVADVKSAIDKLSEPKQSDIEEVVINLQDAGIIPLDISKEKVEFMVRQVSKLNPGKTLNKDNVREIVKNWFREMWYLGRENAEYGGYDIEKATNELSTLIEQQTVPEDIPKTIELKVKWIVDNLIEAVYLKQLIDPARRKAVQSLLKLYRGEVVASGKITGFFQYGDRVIAHTDKLGDVFIGKATAVDIGQEIEITIRHKGGM